MVRRGPPAKGHKARARKVGGVAVGAKRGKGPPGPQRGRAAAPAAPGEDARHRPHGRDAAVEAGAAHGEGPRRPARHEGGDADRPTRGTAAGPHRATKKAAAGPKASAKRRAAARPEEPQALPTKTALRAFLADAAGRVTKSDIARHFGLTSDQRPALRALMREVAAEGGATPAGKRAIVAPSRLPEISPVEVTAPTPTATRSPARCNGRAKAARPSSTCAPSPRGSRR